MLLKMLGPDDRPNGASQTFSIVSGVVEVSFGRSDEDGQHFADVTDAAGNVRRYMLPGRAFVLSDNGHTLDSFNGPKTKTENQKEGRTP